MINMTNVVENLKARSISYDIIGIVCGESYPNVCNYADGVGDLPESAVEKLQRLVSALDEAGRGDVGNVFEKHIFVSRTEDNEEAWIYLYELWANGVISDGELSTLIRENDGVFGLVDLAVTYTGNDKHPMEDEDVEGLRHAEPSDFSGFRNVLQDKVAQ